MCEGTHTRAVCQQMWRPEDNFQGWMLSSSQVGLGDGTPVIRLRASTFAAEPPNGLYHSTFTNKAPQLTEELSMGAGRGGGKGRSSPVLPDLILSILTVPTNNVRNSLQKPKGQVQSETDQHGQLSNALQIYDRIQSCAFIY